MVWLIGCTIVMITILISRRAGIVLVALVTVGWIGLWFILDTTDAQHATHQSITITASSDQDYCPDPALPVSVQLTNTSDRTLENVSFTLLAREQGADQIIYRASHTNHKNLAPAETFSACYGLNSLSFAIRTKDYNARDLRWSAETSLTRFAL